MSSIIEYIGQDKIVHTNNEMIHFRMQTPKPGDVIDFGENYKENPYPFNHARYGTIDSDNAFTKPGQFSVCCHMGSIFLGENYVSISGGPFSSIEKTDIQPAFELKIQDMWNWGNNTPGANHGVYYSIERPVFKWMKK